MRKQKRKICKKNNNKKQDECTGWESFIICSDPPPEMRCKHIETDLSCHHPGLSSDVVSEVYQLLIVLPLCFPKKKPKLREAKPKHADPQLRVDVLFTRPQTAALVSRITLLQQCWCTL